MKDLLENQEHPKGHAGPKAEHKHMPQRNKNKKKNL